VKFFSRAKTTELGSRHSPIATFALLLLLPTAKLPAQDFAYTNTNGTITITGYTGPGGNVTIPSTIDGLPVTSIGDSAFLNSSNLTGITIGNNVANIANWAFFGCSGLTRITIPDRVTNIQDAAVGGFGNGVAGGVFWGCASLTNIVVGKGLSYLGLGAFSGCSNLLGVYFKGNAPTPGSTPLGVYVFGGDSPTVYYLPRTKGWGSTYAGRPAVLWNPEAQTNDGNIGVRQNAFGFNVTGTADIPIVVEATTDLAAQSWVPMQTCTLTNGLIYFSDGQWANYSGRLYRISSP
jgi:hypothetical protein